MPSIAIKFIQGEIELIKQDISNGKVYKKSDFNESVLTSVLDKYKDSISKDVVSKIKGSNKCICCQ